MITPQEEIRIADISKELQRQWEEQEAKNQIRASLFNLIIYSHEICRAECLKDFVETIIEKFPCRIIFIQADKDPSQNYSRASVSNVVTSKGEVSIACDKINVEVSMSQLKRVPYIILPHLLSDLPIYLLWGQDPTKELEILPHLHQYAKRLIFDSECAQDLSGLSQGILKMMENWNIEIFDMHWADIKCWRDVMARTFDNQDKIFQLHDTKTIRIVYNGTKTDWVAHPAIQSVYLQAWIAGQMEWKFEEAAFSEGMISVKYDNEAHQIAVELVSREDPATAPGTILSVEVQTSRETLFAIERQERLPQVVVHISTPQECSMPFSLPLQDSRQSSTFLRDLLYRGSESHYQRALAMIAKIKGPAT